MKSISIITVCYNSESTIRDTIQSVINQKIESLEYIIIDGGSTDDTISICKEYESYIDHMISEPDAGIYDAMNKGVNLASGNVIGILNSDDFYLTDTVIIDVIKAFKANLDVHMVLGNVDFVQSDDLNSPVRFYSSANFKPWKMRFGFMPPHPAAFIKRCCYEKVGSYSLGFIIAADFEWFVRAFLINKISYVKLNKSLVRMREGGVSTSGLNSNWLATKEMNFALKSNNFFSTLLFVSLRLPFKFFNKLYLISFIL